MKKLVCDFCDSLRLGFKIGYREYKKAFQGARQVRILAKDATFNKADTLPDYHLKKVNDIRDLAQKNYDSNNDIIKE